MSSSVTQAGVKAGPRSRPPFRADHVGSLLRPRELAKARAAHKAGSLPAEALRAVPLFNGMHRFLPTLVRMKPRRERAAQSRKRGDRSSHR